jgi:iron(II)-dependent oxidoreductase
MTDNSPVYIISDSPEKDSDIFGFDAYAKTIAELIAHKKNKTPLVIGIYGTWGSGKTTLMETVLSHLKKIETYEDRSHYRDCKTVWFQAWKYREEDEILAAVIEEIFKSMNNEGFFEGCKAEIEKLTKKLNMGKVAGAFTKLISGGQIDISEFFSELEYKEKLGFYDTFQKFFDDLLWTYLKWRPKVCTDETIDEEKGVLVIFIDDLDRCPPEKILKVLETIKLFMDKKGCIFVIGAANDIIERALEGTYKENASKFMDKIVQVTFNLPQIPVEDFESFIKKIHPEIKDAIFPYLKVIVPTMKNNPRRLKRFLNNVNLQEGLVRNKGIKVLYENLLYWNIIDYVYPSLRDEVKDNAQTLFTLKEFIRDIDSKLENKEIWDIPKETLEKVPQSLQSYIQKKEMVDIVRKFDVSPEQLKQLITFSGIVESIEEAKEKEQEAKVNLDKIVEVPAGPFLYGDDRHQENIEQPFYIDVYPVTNSQYVEFMKAGGYSDDKYWSQEGKKWREKNNITEPRFWRDKEWNKPDYPVVGVSYYEADAYARWAGKKLPTEKEWEKAARGTDGRVYPWGNEFDKEKCNTVGSGMGKTTRVTRYHNGISPYGCYDMAGNVWEWTDSWYDKEEITKVLRGGSWYSDRDHARCANSGRDNPNLRYYYVGFRCARTKK